MKKGGQSFVLEAIEGSSELVRAYRLRYQVLERLGYLSQRSNRSGLEIDEYDRYAIPFEAIAVGSGELVGTLRLITPRLQARHASWIEELVRASGDADLCAQAMRPRQRPMPSITSDFVRERLDEHNVSRQEVLELSRLTVHPAYRGGSLSRGLMELGLAHAVAAGGALLIGACIPEHIAMYSRYGYERLPGTGLERYDSVGQMGYTIVCDTRELPEPTRTSVAALVEALRAGTTTLLVDEHEHEHEHKHEHEHAPRVAAASAPGGAWHFEEAHG